MGSHHADEQDHAGEQGKALAAPPTLTIIQKRSRQDLSCQLNPMSKASTTLQHKARDKSSLVPSMEQRR